LFPELRLAVEILLGERPLAFLPAADEVGHELV